MLIEFLKSNASVKGIAAALKPAPSITGATRLETQPTAVGMQLGLRAPLADPLWLLSRQSQFNEFQGEDAGTPLNLKFTVQGRPIDGFRAGPGGAGGEPWQPVQPGAAPLEATVEAEPVWKTHPRLRGEAGLQALRLADNAAVRRALLKAYALELPAPADPDADKAGLLWSTVLAGRAIDSQKLAGDLDPLRDGAGGLVGLPAALNVAAGDIEPTKTMLARWLTWLDGLVFEGAGGAAGPNPSWQRERMEYAFALRSAKVALRADEYTDGHLDWEDFRAEPLDQGDESGPAADRPFAVARRHPSPVRYPGMPADRYWEFEDAQVNFAGAEAGVTDLLRMCVTEFALTFGNDWFVVPVRLPVGGLYQVSEFQITDTFGIVANAGPIEPVGNVPWTLFELSAAPALGSRLAHTILLPDSLDGVHEGAVLEHVQLARDEMANLAWGIEKTVQGVSGEPLDRELEAKGLAFQQQIQFDTQPDSPQLVYRLATPVPANWTPLLPVRDAELDFGDPLEIRLARAGMKRFYPEASVQVLGAADPDYQRFLDGLEAQKNFIDRLTIDADLRAYVFHPRGWVLRRDPTQPLPAHDTLVIEEEEVPRIGAAVRRKFQYARTSDGRSWLWIGRSKLAGRGEAASNLRFDVAVKKTTSR